MEFVSAVKKFNEIAGTKEEFNPRKATLYTGLVLEEVAEMLASYGGAFNELVYILDNTANDLKAGEYDDETDNIDRVEFLDAAVDIAVVALGAGISIGADVEGACNEVMDSNLSKFPIVNGEYTVLKDENGKVKKPESFRKPELAKFLL